MTKMITVVLALASLTMLAQTPQASLIKSWKLKSHTMTGIGWHDSLPKNTQIDFLSDGTWKSTSPWQGAVQGKWNLENNTHKLLISSVRDEEEFRVSQLTDEELLLETRTISAVYKLTLTAMK
jgi:hypothetical protein